MDSYIFLQVLVKNPLNIKVAINTCVLIKLNSVSYLKYEPNKQ